MQVEIYYDNKYPPAFISHCCPLNDIEIPKVYSVWGLVFFLLRNPSRRNYVHNGVASWQSCTEIQFLYFWVGFVLEIWRAANGQGNPAYKSIFT